MPLRCFQKLENFGFGDIVYQVESVNPDTGYSRKVDVSQCEKLPDSDMTDLGKQIKAGVNLERVNCELLNPKGVITLPPTAEEIEAIKKQEQPEDK